MGEVGFDNHLKEESKEEEKEEKEESLKESSILSADLPSEDSDRAI